MTATLRERLAAAILAATDVTPADLDDEDRITLSRVTDVLVNVFASEIRTVANNLPRPNAPRPADDAPEMTWLLAAEWELGFKASRDAVHDLLIERCRELRGTAAVTS